MSLRALLIMAGLGALLVGAILLTTPVRIVSDIAGNRVECGTALHPQIDAVVSDGRVHALSDAMLGQASTPTTDAVRCDDAVGTRQGWSWGLVGVGALAALGGYAVRRPDEPTAAPGPTETADPGAV